MTDTLMTKEQSAVGGRTITNLRFANDIDGLAGKEEQLASRVDRLGKISAAFGINTSTEKTILMTSNTNGISFHIRIDGEKLDEVNSFKYLGAVVKDQVSNV